MVTSKNSHPSLRPVINKHKKVLSIDSNFSKGILPDDKHYTKSLKVSNSEKILPKIFVPPQIAKKCSKSEISTRDKKEIMGRKVFTPYFNLTLDSNRQKKEDTNTQGNFRIKRSSRKNFFDHIKRKRDIGDITFGEVHDFNN